MVQRISLFAEVWLVDVDRNGILSILYSHLKFYGRDANLSDKTMSDKSDEVFRW